jgi:hypothetical protein
LSERHRRTERERREVELLDATADELNREREDVLAYRLET